MGFPGVAREARRGARRTETRRLRRLGPWAAEVLRARLALAVGLALIALTTACAGLGTLASEPSGPPVTYADETDVANPEPVQTPEPEPTALAPEPESSTPQQPLQAEEHEAQAMAVSPSLTVDRPAGPTAENPCSESDQAPLPSPGQPGSQDFWRSFRDPFPPAPVWNPPGTKRVALQAGHWRNSEVPRELGRLIGSGTSAGGRAEWEVNLDIAQRAAAILEAHGVEVDLLPATVPPSYKAHAFISVHADGDLSGALRGFKVARAGFSPIPETDDRLVDALYAEYGPATGLRRDDEHVSMRMRYYYAFNSRRYCHAIAMGVPAAIIETGFLTNASDRAFLLGRPEAAAQGIARGVLSFLGILDSPQTS